MLLLGFLPNIVRPNIDIEFFDQMLFDQTLFDQMLFDQLPWYQSTVTGQPRHEPEGRA
jgi:hypothetical protein